MRLVVFYPVIIRQSKMYEGTGGAGGEEMASRKGAIEGLFKGIRKERKMVNMKVIWGSPIFFFFFLQKHSFVIESKYLFFFWAPYSSAAGMMLGR